jgi:hypothetical protein
MTPPRAPQVPAIECEMHHTSISVPDVREAIDFYTTQQQQLQSQLRQLLSQRWLLKRIPQK